MHLKYLEYFLALARERHFARAAQACHVTQPTLSAGIVALESAVGQQLVLRDRRFIDLTSQGHAILPYVHEMVANYSDLRAVVDGLPGPLRGTVRLGAIPAAMPRVGALAAQITAGQPLLKISVTSLTSREIEQGFQQRELDAGLSYLTGELPAQVDAIPLFHEHFLFATRRTAGLGARAAVSMAEAAGQRLCLLHEGMQNRRLLNAALAARGLAVDPVATANSYVALFGMVCEGGLDAIVTDSHRALFGQHPDIVLVPFSDPPPPNRIGLVTPLRTLVSPVTRAVMLAARRLVIDKPDQTQERSI